MVTKSTLDVRPFCKCRVDSEGIVINSAIQVNIISQTICNISKLKEFLGRPRRYVELPSQRPGNVRTSGGCPLRMWPIQSARGRDRIRRILDRWFVEIGKREEVLYSKPLFVLL